MKNVNTRPLLTSVLWLACSTALAVPGAAPARAPTSLYERLGGDAGVHAIADLLIDRVAADPVHGKSFDQVNLKRVKRLLAQQICELAGGPCKYSGSSMHESHAGLHITEADFYDMVATLRVILEERRVASSATNELLRLLAPMKRDVVEKSAPVQP